MIYAILLPLAVCIDTFAAGVSYGVKCLKIPTASLLIISGIGSFGMGASLTLSEIAARIIPPRYSGIIIGTVLIVMGVISLALSILKKRLSSSTVTKNLTLDGIGLSISIFLDPTLADCDNSCVLSPKEALRLAIPLSLDSVTSGLAVGMLIDTREKLIATVLTLIGGAIAVSAGSLIGRRIITKVSFDMSWLEGAILLILGICVVSGI